MKKPQPKPNQKPEPKPKRRPKLGPQWLSLGGVADHFGVSPMTVRRWTDEEAYARLNFPKPSVVADRRYWDVDVIDAWMRSRVTAVSSRKAKAAA